MDGPRNSTLQHWLSAGREAWPQIRCADAALLPHLQPHLEAGEVSCATDLFLVAAALVGDPSAIAIVDRALKEVAPSARKMLSSSELDEELQVLRTRLFVPTDGGPPKLATYGGRAPLRAWLRVAITRRALSVRRKPALEHADEDVWLALPAIASDPALAIVRQQVAPVFKQAFEAAFRSLDRRDATLLRQHLVDGVVAAQLAKMHGTHRATVHRWITNAKEQLLNALRGELAERLETAGAPFTDLLHAVRSDLGSALTSIMRAAPTRPGHSTLQK